MLLKIIRERLDVARNIFPLQLETIGWMLNWIEMRRKRSLCNRDAIPSFVMRDWGNRINLDHKTWCPGGGSSRAPPDYDSPLLHLSRSGRSVGRSGKLLLALARRVNLGFAFRLDPWLYFCSMQDLHVFWNWGLLFDERNGLTTTGRSPSTGGDSSGHSFINCPPSTHMHTHTTRSGQTISLIQNIKSIEISG
jgi:hypothetical protein